MTESALMRPLPAVSVGVLVAAYLALASPASAQTSCSYDSATATVSVASEDLLVVLAAPGGTIMYSSFSSEQTTPPVETACGSATTGNTDTIRVTGAGELGLLIFGLDTSRGPFAPGMTPEPSGTSEIEIVFEPSVQGAASALGTEAVDLVRFGTLGANINADDDADITLAGAAVAFTYTALGGDDDLAATGGFGTGDPASLPFLADAGAGNDLIVGGPAPESFMGGAGNDRLVGNLGSDELDGGAGADNVSGGPGRDGLSGSGGRDVLRGGPDRDSLDGGPGRDRCVGGPGKNQEQGCK